MLDGLDEFDDGPSERGALEAAIAAHTRRVLKSRGQGDLGLVARAEAEIKGDVSSCIRFGKDGLATVETTAGRWRAGRFEIPTLGELKARAAQTRAGAGHVSARLRLWVLDGVGPATDVGALQATAPPGSLFQVASQFNALESPGPFVTDVANYLNDWTQGPRAAISALPGTLVRHYAAPRADGSRFVQRTDGEQLNLLAAVAGQGDALVRSGYLRAADIAHPERFARVLQDRLDDVRVGLHDDVQVVLGYDWSGGVAGRRVRSIAQVFTSTVAGGMYTDSGGDSEPIRAVCRQLQRAAYLGTLLAAAALGKRRVVLTLIGGGAFANPVDLIWDAIGWSMDEVGSLLHRDLTVVVNGRNLGQSVPPSVLRAAVEARDGGGYLRFDGPAFDITAVK